MVFERVFEFDIESAHCLHIAWFCHLQIKQRGTSWNNSPFQWCQSVPSKDDECQSLMFRKGFG